MLIGITKMAVNTTTRRKAPRFERELSFATVLDGSEIDP
jgi:hypothetical protein